MRKQLFCLMGLLALPLSVSAQETPNHSDVGKSAGTRRASAAEIQALIAAPGPAVDRYTSSCRSVPPAWGKGSPADEAAARLVEIGSPAIDSLLPLLDDREAWRRCLTTDILGRIGDRRVVPALMTHFRSETNDNVRLAAIEAFVMLKDARAEDVLIPALRDNSLMIQGHAIQGLGRIKSPHAIPTLISLFTLPADAAAPEFATLQWRGQIAASALKEIGSEAFPPLLQLLKRPTTPPATLALAIPPASAVGDKRVVPVLLGLLKHPTDEVRNVAVSHLTSWKEARMLPAVIRVLNGPNGQAPYSAARLLAEDGSRKSLEALEQAAFSNNAMARAAAGYSFSYLTTHEATPMLLRVLQKGNKETAPNAASMLGTFHEPNAVPALITALANRESDVRYWTTIALGRFDAPQVIEALLPMLADANAHVRGRAVLALENKHDPRILPALQPLCEDKATEVQSYARRAVQIQQAQTKAASR